MKGFLCLFIALIICGCSPLAVVGSSCDITAAHTKKKYGVFELYILNPDSKENPTIWEGPICIDSLGYSSSCIFSQSLIKSVSYSETSESLQVVTFSGSHSQKWNIGLEKCEVSKL